MDLGALLTDFRGFAAGRGPGKVGHRLFVSVMLRGKIEHDAVVCALRAIPTMSIIVKIWTTCPHVSNVAPYAETSTTDNVPYAELPQTGQKRFTAPR